MTEKKASFFLELEPEQYFFKWISILMAEWGKGKQNKEKYGSEILPLDIL